jgi:hypothetical protein
VHAAGLGEEGAASVEGGTATRFYRLV